MENELILFETADKEIKLTVPIKNNTVWLNRKQLAELFGRDVKTIGKHINNALKEELDNSVVANFATTASDGKVYQVEHYNLDMIISIGYRVKSNRGVEFRKWANSVLKQYIIQGYAINEKRLEALQRTINIQTKMLACTLEVDEAEVLKAVSLYTNALMLLDQYDHQSLKKPTGSKAIYRITYEDCRNMVNAMEDSFHSDVFGIEKEKGKVEGILAAVYQNVFGGDVYPSLEEKITIEIWRDNEMNIKDFKWTREPDDYTLTDDKIEIITQLGTDLWQRTYYHFRNDNAPVLQIETEEKFFSFIVKTDFKESHHRFDQCGVVMYLDSENWLKGSIEYENDNFQHLGSVVTNNGYSDWATTEIDAEIKSMWYRLSRREDDYCIECSEDGIRFKQMRICHMWAGAGKIKFGIYACSPEDSSFKAVFTDMKLTECQWKAHDGQKPDEM